MSGDFGSPVDACLDMHCYMQLLILAGVKQGFKGILLVKGSILDRDHALLLFQTAGEFQRGRRYLFLERCSFPSRIYNLVPIIETIFFSKGGYKT